MNNGYRNQALVGTTPPPYIPPQVTASYTAAPPQVQQSQAYTLAPSAYTPAPGVDFLGFFGGTPHPLLDFGRFFNGAGAFGRR